MRLSAIVHEAKNNVVSGTTKAVFLSVVLGVLSLAAVVSDMLAVSSLVDEATAYQSSGASIVTIVAPGRIDGERCEDIGRMPGVRAAGAIAISRGQRVTALPLPGAPMQAASITPGFVGVLGADADGGPGVLLPEDLAFTLGLERGDPLVVAEGTTRTAGTYQYPRDGRRNGYGYLAMSAVAPGGAVFDECWVDAWPQNPDIRSLLLLTVLSGDLDQPPTISQLNPSKGANFSGSARYDTRVTRFSGAVFGSVAVVVGFIAIWSRRVEIASSLHDRIRRHDLWLIVSLELAVWVVPPVLLSMAVSIAYFGAASEPGFGAVLGARGSFGVQVGALVGAYLALAVTRERDLLRHTKDR